MTADRHAAILVVASLFIAATVAMCDRPAHSHDGLEHWLSPYGARCCSDLKRECRPVRSYLGDDGRFYVFLSGRWKVVPDDAVLAGVSSPDGSSYACADLDDRIHCFVNGGAKF